MARGTQVAARGTPVSSEIDGFGRSGAASHGGAVRVAVGALDNNE